jgi:hypothetical protein
MVEQDPTISAQLSLWRQSGSDVDMGQLRVVPLDSALLYVQPVFLKGTVGATGAIPQLQRIVVSDGTSVFMAPTLREALLGLARDTLGGPERDPESTPAPGDWAARALEILSSAERALRDGQWAEFGRQWSALQELLRRAAAAPPRR